MDGKIEITNLGDFIETDNLYPYIAREYIKKAIYHFLCSEQQSEVKLISFLTKKIKYVMRKTYIENVRADKIIKHPKNKLTVQFNEKEYVEIEYEGNFANVIFSKNLTSLLKLLNKIDIIFKNHTNVERDIMYKSLFTNEESVLNAVTNILHDSEYEEFKTIRSKILDSFSFDDYRKTDMILLIDRNSDEYKPFSREVEYTNKEVMEIKRKYNLNSIDDYKSNSSNVLQDLIKNTEKDEDKDLLRAILYHLNSKEKICIISNKSITNFCRNNLKILFNSKIDNPEDYFDLENISFIEKRIDKDE